MPDARASVAGNAVVMTGAGKRVYYAKIEVDGDIYILCFVKGGKVLSTDYDAIRKRAKAVLCEGQSVVAPVIIAVIIEPDGRYDAGLFKGTAPLRPDAESLTLEDFCWRKIAA